MLTLTSDHPVHFFGHLEEREVFISRRINDIIRSNKERCVRANIKGGQSPEKAAFKANRCGKRVIVIRANGGFGNAQQSNETGEVSFIQSGAT